MADDPELTDEDYPTDEALARIRTAPPREALELAERAWHWDGWASRELRPEERAVVTNDVDEGAEFVRFATGGWSGNESIIAALDDNWPVAVMCWRLTARGGLHIYEMPKAVDAVDPPVGDSTVSPRATDSPSSASPHGPSSGEGWQPTKVGIVHTLADGTRCDGCAMCLPAPPQESSREETT
jgi:hypothetical protein